MTVTDGAFDIAYLPDFDEEYAINVDGKWSQAELKLQIANGWMMQSVDDKIDNSAITSFLTEQAGKTLDVLRAFAELKLKLPTSGLQGETSGTKVTVRLRTLTYVVPGLYPLAKPKEIANRCKRGSGESAQADTPIASGVSNIQNDCEELFHFHTRTESIVEVLSLPEVAGANANGSPTADIKAAQDALHGVAVTVIAVTPGTATSGPIVKIKPASNRAADRTKQLKAKALAKLHAAKGFEKAAVKWDNEE